MKIIKRVFFVLVLLAVLGYMYYSNYPIFRYGNDDFGIVQYHSVHDKDEDGIDDQMDILLGAKDYLDTKPKYKSIYYSSGYPDDDHGVCTDVVGSAFKRAGYDLMELVNQDILLHTSDYNIDKIDKCIDFRRVVNLDVYFQHVALTLTNDIDDIHEWQGGDIVVFHGHIGIVSDTRNSDGIPYVLHHSNPMQVFYEEDILEAKQEDIIGHYRMR